MSTSFRSTLKSARARHLLEVKRRLKNVGSTVGFAVSFSDSLVLFHVLEKDTFRLNGYTVVRMGDITQYRVFSKATCWQLRAVRHLRLKPRRPAGISVASLPELVKSVAQHYPLMTFQRGKKNPDVCYIGPLVSMTERTFTIADLDANAEWRGERRLEFGDITAVVFGGGYEAALALTAPKRPTTRGKGLTATAGRG